MGRRWRPTRVALAVVLAGLSLVACESSTAGRGAPAGTPVSPDRATAAEVDDGSSVQVPEGGVTDRGTLTVATVPPPGPAPAGLVLLGPAYDIALRGGRFAAGTELSLVVPPLLGRPNAALLGRYDDAAGRWMPLAATYRPEQARLVVALRAPGSYAAFGIDGDRLVDQASATLAGFLLPSFGATAPTCVGDPAAARIKAQVTPTTTVLSCVGVRDGAPELSVTNDRGQVLAVDVPTRWRAASAGTPDIALQAVLEVTSALPGRGPAPEGRRTVLLGPGVDVDFGLPAGRTATLRLTPDARAVVATGLAYGVAVLTTSSLEVPWIGAKPAPAESAALIAATLAEDPCAAEVAELATQPASTGEQLSGLLRAATGLALRCLADGWPATLGLPTVGPLTAVLRWLAVEADRLVDGPDIGSALDFANVRIEIAQSAA